MHLSRCNSVPVDSIILFIVIVYKSIYFIYKRVFIIALYSFTSDSSFALTNYQENKAQQREKYRQLISERYDITIVPDNCIFACFAHAFVQGGIMFNDDVEFDPRLLRKIISEEIFRWDSSDHRPPGILDGSFIGTNIELEIIVQHFSLSVSIFDSSDSLSDVADWQDLPIYECKSAYLPYVEAGLSNDRFKIVLLREDQDSFQYSVLYEREADDAAGDSHVDDAVESSDDDDDDNDDDSDDESARSSAMPAPKFTTLHRGLHDGSVVPRVPPISFIHLYLY